MPTLKITFHRIGTIQLFIIEFKSNTSITVYSHIGTQ
jgi:hypothetical protein